MERWKVKQVIMVLFFLVIALTVVVMSEISESAQLFDDSEIVQQK
ncbi:hypothetical protein [Guptibacillus algicola]|nr:hypothetical protein [Alkalihalobacillus algicola]